MHIPHYSVSSSLPAVFALIPDAVFASCSASPLRAISINASRDILKNPLTRLTIEDVQQLLQKGFLNATVPLNDPAADVQIVLPEINPDLQHRIPRFALPRPYHYLPYPDHAYEWRSYCKDGKTVLKLETPSYQGVSFGLYGLLQEKLGFKFYHPKRTIIPSHKSWPVSAVFRWKAMPRFDKKGFHIHSLHPIELTEQIHNPNYPTAVADLKEYMDWLARNQQNVVQFCLLRGVDRDRWIEHAVDFVNYAHKRGILTGVAISLSSVQQQAFTAIKLLNLSSSYRRQIDDTLSWLFRVKWDFVSVDFSMGEYLPDLGRLLPSSKRYMVKEITERYNTKLLYTTHVIPDKEKDTIKNAGRPQPLRSREPREADMPKTGILIHAVMCYSITEPYAPVYGNLNQRSMLDRAIRENQRQETWYWPESAYWVSFDNSVPLLLLMYLDSRLSDMETMKKIGVSNHLTFSSGWEWGYWLVDWSVARWSWKHIEGGKEAVPGPLDMLRDLFPDQRIRRLWHEALRLQNHYLKEAGLMPFFSALDPSAELPWPFNKPFQPRPPFSYRWLLKRASDAEAEEVLQGPVAVLEEYARKMNTVVAGLSRASKRNFHGLHNGLSERGVILEELTRGLEMTALRASHRALTIRALIEKKKERVGKGELSEHFLAEAASVRAYAQSLVRQQETIYRYPVGLIARKREDYTSYRFGYLYPVSNLFFWFREEQQVRNTRFDGLYMSIWNFRKLLSIESLLW